MAPSDEYELSKMISFAVRYNKGPIAFRYPRGEALGSNLFEDTKGISIGKGRLIKDSSKEKIKADIALIAIGTRLKDCFQASTNLESVGIKVSVADARFVKPFDKDLIFYLAKNHKAILTVEEGSIGGFSTHVLNYLANNDLLNKDLKFSCLTLPDKFIEHKSQAEQVIEAKLDKLSIFNKACEILNKKHILSAV